MKKLLILGLLFCSIASAVTLPFTFSTGTIKPSEVNANFSVLRDAQNSHEAGNGHTIDLEDVLTIDNSTGAQNIDFNFTQAQSMLIENVGSDPTCGGPQTGQIILNTSSTLLKFCDGTSFISIAGTGVNTLTTVLNAGNSAGTFDIDLNLNELLSARVENLAADPAFGSAGRLIFNTTETALKLDTGTAFVAIGGSQGLASVLGVLNSAGANDIDFNLNEAVQLILEKLATPPGGTEGRVFYDTTAKVPKFFNGTSTLEIGNTNTLTQVLSLGNSTGANDIDFNNNEAIDIRLENLAASPGTGNPGRIWFNTSGQVFEYQTSTTNKEIASLSDSQTFTNKSIDGSTNTLTNIPDGALSSNVVLLTGAQTISGVKTFSTAPISARILGGLAGTLGHLIPDLAADDTFALLNAVQTFVGKTLQGVNFTGTQDHNFFEAQEFVVENLAANPAAGNAGRIFFKTATGELLYDNGTIFNVLGLASTPDLNTVLSSGNSAGANDIDVNLNELLNVRIENLAGLPAAGNVGRLVFDTVGGVLSVDDGSSFSTVLVGSIDLTSDVTGVLPVANGGTNSSTALNNDRVILSSGGSIVESGALVNGQLVIGSTGLAPVIATISGTSNQVNVANGAGSITLSTPQDIATASSPSFTGLTVSGLTASRFVVTDGSSALASQQFIDLTSEVSNALPIANGGTGQTTQTAAYDALSPNTTKGDLVVHNGTDNIREPVGANGFVLTADSALSSGIKWAAVSGTGDVVGPSGGSTDEAIARFDGTTGLLLQDSNVLISDTDVVSGITQLNVDNLRLDGNSIISTDTNGDIILNPDGTGSVQIPDLTASQFVVTDGTSQLTTQANISLTGDISGVLPIANGGTNSSTALNSNRFIVSSGGAIVESSAKTQGSVIFADSDGLPTEDNVGLFFAPSTNSLGVGTATPNAKFEIQTIAAQDPSLRLSDDDVDIPMTALTITPQPTGKTIGQLSNVDGLKGGMFVLGTSDTDAIALLLEGITGSNTPTISPIVIRGAKYNGGTGKTNIGASEILFEIQNDSSDILISISGDGTMKLNQLTASQLVKTNASKELISAATIDLTSEVANALPIANGGTGQTTQTAAYDALSPNTTKGDLVVHNGTDNVREPVGTNGFVLTADSALSSGVKWAAGSGGSGDVVGPSGGSTDEAIARFDGTTGLLLQDSVVLMTDAGIMTGITALTVDTIIIDGDTINATGGSDNLVLSSGISGEVQIAVSRDLRLLNDSNLRINTGNLIILAGKGVFENIEIDLNTISSATGNIILDPAVSISLPDLAANRFLVTDGSSILATQENIDLTSDITGALPFANGGTGQITQTLGFDALDPLTTKGDLIVHNGTNSIRLAVGTNGQVLTVDSAQPTGLKYDNAGTAFTTAAIDLYTASSKTGSVVNFGTIVDNTGAASMTLSSGSGDNITIDVAGLYSISAHVSITSNDNSFITKNRTTITSSSTDNLAKVGFDTSSSTNGMSWKGQLAVNDVIRVLTEGTIAGGSASWRFTIVRVK